MCGGKFHQPWSQDAGSPQCGRIGSHEEALAIVFPLRRLLLRQAPLADPARMQAPDNIFS